MLLEEGADDHESTRISIVDLSGSMDVVLAKFGNVRAGRKKTLKHHLPRNYNAERQSAREQAGGVRAP